MKSFLKILAVLAGLAAMLFVADSGVDFFKRNCRKYVTLRENNNGLGE